MKLVVYISFLFISLNSFSQINIVKKTIFFESGSSRISNKQKSTIDSLLKASKYDSISLVGYTDSIGNQKNNIALASKRCVAVKDEIRKIDNQAIITFMANGENSTLNTVEWQQRRVEIKLIYLNNANKEMWKDKGLVQSKVETKNKPVVKRNSISTTTTTTTTLNKANDIPPKQIFSDLLLSADKIVIDNLQFEAGSDRFLHDKAPNEIYYLADILKKQPTLKIEIVGHVCCVNDKKLSVDRAKKVETFLKSKGVAKKQMTHRGMSNSKPLVKEITKEDQQKNRRVEIIILER